MAEPPSPAAALQALHDLVARRHDSADDAVRLRANLTAANARIQHLEDAARSTLKNAILVQAILNKKPAVPTSPRGEKRAASPAADSAGPPAKRAVAVERAQGRRLTPRKKQQGVAKRSPTKTTRTTPLTVSAAAAAVAAAAAAMRAAATAARHASSAATAVAAGGDSGEGAVVDGAASTDSAGGGGSSNDDELNPTTVAADDDAYCEQRDFILNKCVRLRRSKAGGYAAKTDVLVKDLAVLEHARAAVMGAPVAAYSELRKSEHSNARLALKNSGAATHAKAQEAAWRAYYGMKAAEAAEIL